LTGNEFDVHATVVINAAGPFCDEVQKIADKSSSQMISPSSGVHIVLPDYYSPDHMGLIVPKTKDGHVVFMLPWLGCTVAGTTDSATTLTMRLEAHEEEIEFILDAISDYILLLRSDDLM
jgi:glycerol-3-phosphate dehydrogenase